MLENERIIVQDRGGIDAGIAALMQNANKGFDPAALMAMMNNGNGMFGGNGGFSYGYPYGYNEGGCCA